MTENYFTNLESDQLPKKGNSFLSENALQMLAEAEQQKSLQPQLPPSNVLGLEQMASLYPSFPMGWLRWTLHKNRGNFRKRVCIKIGGRLFIKVKEFFDWLEDQNEIKTA